MKRALAGCGAALLLAACAVRAQEPGGASAPEGLLDFLQGHVKKLEAQDAEGAIANLHSKGKNRDKSVADLRAQLPRMPFTYRILDPRYIGTDGDLHYLRYRQQTRFDAKWKQASGAPGIEMDVVTIFGKEDGHWKIFDTYLFSQQPLVGE